MALHELAGERISMQLVTPTPEFAYRPLAVAEPFGLGEARRYDVVRMAADHRAAVHIAGIKSVDTARHRVVTWDGRELPFDVLLVAVGARATTSIPGSVMVQGPGYTGRFRTLLRDLEERRVHNVAFAVPPGASWPLPLYELALMTATHVADHGLRKVRLSLVTPETAPLELFGAAASETVRRATRGTRHRAAPLALSHALRGRRAVARTGRDALSRASGQPAQPGWPTAGGAAGGRERLHPCRPPRPRAGRTGCLRRRRCHELTDQAGRRGHPAGRCGRGGNRGARRCRPGAAALPSGACVGCFSPARRRATCAPR